MAVTSSTVLCMHFWREDLPLCILCHWPSTVVCHSHWTPSCASRADRPWEELSLSYLLLSAGKSLTTAIRGKPIGDVTLKYHKLMIHNRPCNWGDKIDRLNKNLSLSSSWFYTIRKCINCAVQKAINAMYMTLNKYVPIIK